MKKLTYALFFLFGLMAFSTQTWAQSTVTGKVTDKKNVAVAGASVVIKGTVSGTTTDKNGNFSLAADPSSVLVVSFGPEKQEVALKPADKNVTVKFKSALKDLQKQMEKSTGTGKKKKK